MKRDYKICSICGKEFRTKNKEFCSSKCQYIGKSIKHRNTITCSECGKVFTRIKGKSTAETAFCSRKCRNLFESGSIIYNNGELEKISTIKKKYKNKGVGNGKIKLEHRLIMEEYIGRELAKDEIVHHIDGNKFNNDISNLQILTRSEHMKLHMNMRKEQNAMRNRETVEKKCGE